MQEVKRNRKDRQMSFESAQNKAKSQKKCLFSCISELRLGCRELESWPPTPAARRSSIQPAGWFLVAALSSSDITRIYRMRISVFTSLLQLVLIKFKHNKKTKQNQ